MGKDIKLAKGMETLRTAEEDGGETATARFEEIVKLNPATSQYKAL